MDFCPSCRGIFCDSGELDRVVGGTVDRGAGISLPPLDATPLPCPACRARPLRAAEVAGADGVEVWDCRACGGTWLDGGTVPRLRSLARRGPPARTRAVEPPPPGLAVPLGEPLGEGDALAYDVSALSGDAPAESSRLAFDDPISRRIALPLAFAVAVVVTSGALGRLMVTPIAIQIHELGHAVPAWLSGRAALPLPCGLTFWREEQSLFTASCLAFLFGVLGHRGWREGRRFPVVVALAGWSLQLLMFVVLSAGRSRELVIAGGMAGELVLSTLLVVAFYFPLPDRLRWDFWRYVALLPAALTFVSALRLWWEVRRDPRRMPMRALYGGDGFSDLSRLMNEYDWSTAGIIRFYWGTGLLCALAIVACYAWFLWQSRPASAARR